MNYMFGIGLALWPLRPGSRCANGPGVAVAVSTLFVLALFFCHLFALGLYGLELLAFETHRLWARAPKLAKGRGRELARFRRHRGAVSPALLLLVTGPTWESAGVPAYWDLAGKIDGVTLAISIYFPWVAYGLVALLALAALLAWRRGILHFHPVGWALLGSAPSSIWRCRASVADHLADQRLPIALAFMLVACISVDLEDRRLRAGFVALLAVLLAARLTEVQTVWNDLSRGPEEALRAVKSIARGARVLVVHADRSSTGLISDLGLVHIASLATIERSALVSTAFTVEGKHILQVRDEFRPMWTPATARRHRCLISSTPPSGRVRAISAISRSTSIMCSSCSPIRAPPIRTQPGGGGRQGQHFQLYQVIARRLAELANSESRERRLFRSAIRHSLLAIPDSPALRRGAARREARDGGAIGAGRAVAGGGREHGREGGRMLGERRLGGGDVAGEFRLADRVGLGQHDLIVHGRAVEHVENLSSVGLRPWRHRSAHRPAPGWRGRTDKRRSGLSRP